MNRDQVRVAMAGYHAESYDPDEPGRRAAVLMLLYERPDGVHIIFQKRTETVDDHKGQVSLPGGSMDPEDASLADAALRETFEEVGVQPADVELLGQLDELRTSTNYRITPFVGWLKRYPYEWRFSEHEVAYLMEVPLAYLMNPQTFIPDRRTMNGVTYTFPSYQFGPDLIWGATARMVANFLDICASIARD
ncbi:MAG TPA: CoA pyrophosphatase [Tepidiformaceae bacterium]|nr:CoA pyrophosphatase [Tepidiformaceae bacterium]